MRNSIRKIYIFIGLFGLPFVIRAQDKSDSFLLEAPSQLLDSNKRVLWATQYFIPQISPVGSIPFLDTNNISLNFFADTCQFCEAALEGTVFIRQSTGKIVVLNYERMGDSQCVDCRKCKKYSSSKLKVEKWGRARWSISDSYGRGVKNYHLIPYRTIAVDPNYIPYGSVIYIPAVRGLQINSSNGSSWVHDGYFFGGDTGGEIFKNHIDIFTGTDEQNPFPNLILSHPAKTFYAYIIKDSKITEILKSQHLN